MPLITESDRQLLVSAFGEPDEAVSAWETWRSKQDIEQDVSPDAYQVLPRVAANLERAGFSDEYSDRLAGVRRKTWYKNQRIVRDGLAACDLLQKADVAFALEGSTGVLARFVMDASLLPLERFELVVAARSAQSIDILRKEGWREYYESRGKNGAPRRVLLRSLEGTRLSVTMGDNVEPRRFIFAVEAGSDDERVLFVDRELRVVSTGALVLRLAVAPDDLFGRSVLLRTASVLPILVTNEPIPTDDLFREARKEAVTAQLKDVLGSALEVLPGRFRSELGVALQRHRARPWEVAESRRSVARSRIAARLWRAWYRQRRSAPDRNALFAAVSFGLALGRRILPPRAL
jgi:hypothetical protein